MNFDYPDLPILDSHIHLDPAGNPETAVRRFTAEGGTHLIVIHKPYDDLPISTLEDYRRAFNRTLLMARKAEGWGVKSWAVLGPYPVELMELSKRMGLEEARKLQMSSVDLALEMVENGEALGLGEIGRIHFPVSNEIQNCCDEILLYALRGCKDLNCPAILHTESLDENGELMDHLASIADRAGIDRKRVIKHYSNGGMCDPMINLGLSVSVLSHSRNLRSALETGNDFLLETDYIDSPDRPNVVLPPDMVPKKIKWAYRASILDEKKHSRLMIDHPKRVLGIETDP